MSKTVQSEITNRIENWQAIRRKWDIAIEQAGIAERNFLEWRNKTLPEWRELSESERQAHYDTNALQAKCNDLKLTESNLCQEDCDALDAIMECPVLMVEDIHTKAAFIKKHAVVGGVLDGAAEWAGEALLKSFITITTEAGMSGHG